ncbi:MAG: sulfurtransferase-like selenium metabolism protein YedF, partial [Clostridia bacterium]|nr:sulfurtransferase-like selenium metabolism protein YedF [Clostridia bacterium]
PIPVILTKKAIEAGATELAVEVDNAAAVENVGKFAAAQGYSVEKAQIAGGFRLTLRSSGAPSAAAAAITEEALSCVCGGNNWALFLTRDSIGVDNELGLSLAKMMLYALAESDDLPSQILLMNEGVRLAVNHEEAVGHLRHMAERGVEILVCGTCLNYYGLDEQLQTGSVSNMYDILSRIQAAAKVVTI